MSNKDFILEYINGHPEGVGLNEIAKALAEHDPTIGRGSAFPPEIAARSLACRPLKRLATDGDIMVGTAFVKGRRSERKIYFPKPEAERMGIVRCDSVQRAMRDKELMPAFTCINGHAAVYFRRIGSEASYATIIYPELLAYFKVDCLITASIDVGLPSGETVRMHRAELLQLMRQRIRADLE